MKALSKAKPVNPGSKSGGLLQAAQAFLKANPGQSFIAHGVAKALGTHGNATRQALLKLEQLGEVAVTSTSPNTYSATGLTAPAQGRRP